MKVLISKTFILFTMIVGTMGVSNYVYASRKSSSAPKVKNCAVFLGAPTEGIGKSGSTPEQLASSYVKILEWLLDKKLITLEEAHETISSTTPTVPKNYIGLSENYHAANQGLKMLVAQMNTEDHQTWKKTQILTTALLNRLNQEAFEKNNAKQKAGKVFNPHIVDTIDFSELVPSGVTLKGVKVVVSNAGQIVWAALDEKGNIWPGVDRTAQKPIPSKSGMPKSWRLILHSNGRALITAAQNDSGLAEFTRSILVYDVLAARMLLNLESLEQEICHLFEVWFSKGGEVNVVTTNPYTSQLGLPIVSVSANGEFKDLILPADMINQSVKVHALDSGANQTILIVQGKCNQSQDCVVAFDAQSFSVVDIIYFSKNDRKYRYNYQINGKNGSPDKLVIWMPENDIQYFFNHGRAKRFIKNVSPLSAQIEFPSFIGGPGEELEALFRDGIGVITRIRYNADEIVQELPKIKLKSDGKTIKIDHPTYGGIYIDIHEKQLFVDQPDKKEIRSMPLLPNFTLHRFGELIQRTLPNGEFQLLINDIDLHKLHLIDFESELNE